ncbi:unnamed protein product, partial [Didymodactylos carnosus]
MRVYNPQKIGTVALESK